jgi:hypothetical protein
MTQVIQTGLSDGKQLEVVSGLNEGDEVLVRSFSVSQMAVTTSTGTNPFLPNMPSRRSGTGGGGGGGAARAH